MMSGRTGDAVLMALVASYFVILGADVFGQTTLAATAFEAPPRSLAMFQGEYVYDSGPFWRIATSVTTALAVLALALNWRSERRSLLLFFLVAFLVINAVSLGYIFPAYGELVSSPYSDSIDPDLLAQGRAWRRLATGRWIISMAVGFVPMIALTRGAAERVSARPTGGSS